MKFTGFSITDILSSGCPEGKQDVKIDNCYDNNVLNHYSSLYRCTCAPLNSSSPSKHVTSTSEDGDDDKITRRPRTSITICQRDHLEREFQKERYPTLAYIDKLSHRVHLPQYVIKVWFQNRRAKYRKEGHRRNKQKLIVTSASIKNSIDLSRSSLPWPYNDANHTSFYSNNTRSNSPIYTSHYPTSTPTYTSSYTSTHFSTVDRKPSPFFSWQCNRNEKSRSENSSSDSESNCNCQKCLLEGSCYVKY